VLLVKICFEIAVPVLTSLPNWYEFVYLFIFIYVAWKQALGLSGGTVVTLCHALIMGSSRVTWKAVTYGSRYNLRLRRM
jgi:hypothetical protein